MMKHVTSNLMMRNKFSFWSSEWLLVDSQHSSNSSFIIVLPLKDTQASGIPAVHRKLTLVCQIEIRPPVISPP